MKIEMGRGMDEWSLENDDLIDHIFKILQNLIICATLAAAGGAAIKYGDMLIYGRLSGVVIGTLFVFSSIALFFLDFQARARRIIKRRREMLRHQLQLVFAIALYAVCLIAGFLALQVLMLQLSHVFA